MTFLVVSKKIHLKTAIFAILIVISIILSCVFVTRSEHISYETGEHDYIKWVDFSVEYTPLKQALKYDIDTYGKKVHLNWISLLSLAACKNGGNFKDKNNEVIDNYAKRLTDGEKLSSITKEMKYYDYYFKAYSAILRAFVGKSKENGSYGLKAFSPIAYGFGYSHSDDFGNSRSYGFARKHLGNDLMGTVGTPIISVEDGIIENLGWNRYGGWRIGIRSTDFKRYYYYAHLKSGHPFVEGLKEGMSVKAGQVIGYLGMTGYSDNEDYNGMNVPHLHFGLQLIFDDSQVEGNNEIWIDVYNIVRLLEVNRQKVIKNEVINEYEPIT